ncbi:hypothetical protein PQQ51_20040 [Paraburkholderia xenovorans]|uniref:hypothetical protein n=1 Tax=Paraburkholderia xenovorans TaxID=36873 RepID=UPI0038BCF36D
MPDETALWRIVEYEGFEIHVTPRLAPDPTVSPTDPPTGTRLSAASDNRYTYVGYVCHPGADPRIPGHAVPFHADGEENFADQEEALDEGVHVGRSIIEGTHPDLTVLPLVTGGV